MFKKTVLGITTATIVTVSAFAITTSTAQAGSFSFGLDGVEVELGAPDYNDDRGFSYDDNDGVSDCWHWKRKWHRTGRRKFLNAYHRCVRDDD